jgi:hypothetical protein
MAGAKKPHGVQNDGLVVAGGSLTVHRADHYWPAQHAYVKGKNARFYILFIRSFIGRFVE